MTTATGYVLFRLGDATLATRLDDVREIVRLERLERLPATTAPFAGVMDVRGRPLPVLDVRAVATTGRGDVLVMTGDDVMGVAVDAVLAVLATDDLPDDGAGPARTMPTYVVGVRRRAGQTVLLVDLRLLVEATTAERVDAAG